MKKILTVIILMLCFTFTANAQWIISSTSQQTENFDGIGSAANDTIPAGFVLSAGTTYTGTVVTNTTFAYGTSGAGAVTGTSSGGYVNWASGVTASSTDRSIGFLSATAFTSPRDIMIKIQNNTGSTISSIDISFDYEKYRTGTRAWDWTFFHGSDGTVWTANTAGDQNYSADGANGVVNPPTTISKSFTISGLTLTNGSFYYFRWHYAGVGGSTNAQGLGLDNVKLTLNQSAAPPPILSAAVGATVDAPFNVTFSDDATWRGQISGITIGGTPLTAGYSVSAGVITFTPSASVPVGLLRTAGNNKAILVSASGYNNASVSQTIGVGAANKLGLNMQPGSPSSNGGVLTPQPVVAIQDQYGNTTTSTASIHAEVGSGTWIISGTINVSAVNGVATFANLTATSPALVTGATIDFTSTGLTHIESNGFNIPAPPLYYYSQGSVDPTLLTSWNTERNGSGSALANFSNGDALIIQNTHSMTTSQAWAISGSGGKLQIENGGTLTSTFAITVSSGTTFQIDNGGTYNHANATSPASTIFAGTENFGASSNFNLQNWPNGSTAIPSGVAFGNLTITWDPGATWQQSGALNTVNGNFTLNNNSANIMRLSAGSSLTLNIGGDFIITSGILQFNNATASNTYILNIGGSFNQTGGSFVPNTSTANLAVNFTGNNKTFTHSAGTLTNTQIKWSINNGASLTLANDLLVADNKTIAVNGTLDLGTSNLTGTNVLDTLRGSGTIKLAGSLATQVTGFSTNTFTGTYDFTGAGQTIPAGTYSGVQINGTGTTLGGNINLTGVLTLTSGTLNLNGNDLQLDTIIVRTSGNIDASSLGSAVVFSNSTPITLPASLFTGNVYYFDLVDSGGVTLSDPLNIVEMLTITSGILTLGPNDVTILEGGALKQGWSQSYVRTNGTGSLIAQALDTGFAQTFSVGNSTYNPVLIEYHGAIRDWKVSVKDTITSGVLGPNPEAKVNREWNITPSNVTGVSADLTFQWNDSDQGVDFDTALGLVVAHFDASAVGNGWFPKGSTHVQEGSEGPGSCITTVTGMTGFSPYAVANEGVLPVELASFTSSLVGRDAKLSWTTNSEINNSGFDVERKNHEADTWKKIGNVQGAGTTSIAKNYTYIDKKLETGKFDYRLKQIDHNGNYRYYDLSTFIDVTTPTVFSLSQNYPNPFNPTTKIDYDLPVDSRVEIMLYDMTGREVASLVNAAQTAGYHTVSFNASSMASGMYFYRITASGSNQNFVKTMKMVLVK